MAGKPGMKGGGGARPGAGRKRKEPPVSNVEALDDPKAFLISLMNDVSLDARIRSDAAKALLPYTHQKIGEGGKKDERADAAKKAASGKFRAAPAPLKLVR